MVWGVIFSVATAGFLTGCLIAAVITEGGAGNPKTTRPGRASNARVTRPADPFCDGTWGDDPAAPEHLKVSRFHGERNRT
jgi:hypothetical protein